MLLLAAETLPDPTHWQSVAWVGMALFTLAGGANQALGFWQKITRPNGAEAIHESAKRYQPKGDYVTRGEFQELKRDVSAELETIRADIRQMENRMSDASEERINRVHERIDEMGERFDAVGARFDAVGDRIIAQLSTLGVLVRPERS